MANDTQFSRYRNTPDADEAQILNLTERLQQTIEQATENADALIDKDCGVLTQKTTRKLGPTALLPLGR